MLENKEKPASFKLKRGGARNKRDRVSMCLTRGQCETAIAATLTAVSISLLPNRFITISWELGGLRPELTVQATGRFIKLVREWVQSQGHTTAWLWVQECGPVIGAHCHILLHVPPNLDWEFRSRPRAWVTKILNGHYVRGALQSKRFTFAPRRGEPSSIYIAELLGRLHYMLKCTPRRFESELGLASHGRVTWGQRQKVIGKRVGVWQGWRRVGSPELCLQLAVPSQSSPQDAFRCHAVAKPPSCRK